MAMNFWKSSLLHLYYHGSLPYRRWANRRAAAKGRAPVLVFFYHRVADDAANPWTVSNRTFACDLSQPTRASNCCIVVAPGPIS